MHECIRRLTNKQLHVSITAVCVAAITSYCRFPSFPLLKVDRKVYKNLCSSRKYAYLAQNTSLQRISVHGSHKALIYVQFFVIVAPVGCCVRIF